MEAATLSVVGAVARSGFFFFFSGRQEGRQSRGLGASIRLLLSLKCGRKMKDQSGGCFVVLYSGAWYKIRRRSFGSDVSRSERRRAAGGAGAGVAGIAGGVEGVVVVVGEAVVVVVVAAAAVDHVDVVVPLLVEGGCVEDVVADARYGEGGAAGEVLGLALVGSRGAEEARLNVDGFVEEARVLEARDHGLPALDARVGDGADLAGAEAVPAAAVELAVEACDVLGVDEVNERVAHVALVLEVDRQIKKVVAALELDVDLVQDRLLGVLVRDVPHHQRRPLVSPARDAVEVERVVVLLTMCASSSHSASRSAAAEVVVARMLGMRRSQGHGPAGEDVVVRRRRRRVMVVVVVVGRRARLAEGVVRD
mmetsp:Transcript_9446/g.30833  ORF Transcript_9446/g.30833 Transcript_9446/m.30833 type:complete len:366 (-) Transcript_9446:91-1188(-)